MIVLLIKKKTNWKEIVLTLREDREIEIVRALLMRINCFLEEPLDYRFVAT